MKTPGAVHSGNFTYMGYSPTFNTANEDFIPFVMALQTALGVQKPIEVPGLGSYAARVEKARKDKLRKGVILPIYVKDSSNGGIGYDADKLHDNLVRIKESGANWVSLLQLFYQTFNDSSEVFAHKDYTPSFESLKNIVQDAHDIGLNVMLKADVNILPNNRKTGEWSGTILPEDPINWWRTYTNLILEMAEFSKKYEVEMLEIGLELSNMEVRYEKEWRQLIKEVRKKYSGLVTYQSNYDVFFNVPWAGDLDVFGIAAYFELTDHYGPTVSELVEGWKEPVNIMKKWVEKNPGVPFEFTEIGYASQPGAGKNPWAWSPSYDSKLDLEEQRNCFEALKTVVAKNDFITGVHMFASVPQEPDPTDMRYIIYGKPAQQVMEEIFKLR
ncbi:MAG: hypothetical protein HGA85_02440 [Nanoarchaeota archaeon]|nr:hypothetical protein [Nanoarchaeota archaeon]